MYLPITKSWTIKKKALLNVSYLMTQIEQQDGILAVIPSLPSGNWGH